MLRRRLRFQLPPCGARCAMQEQADEE